MNWHLSLVRYFSGLIVATLLLSSCTDANPKVTLLKTLENFELKSPQIVTSDLTTVTVRASCTSFITGVELSFDGGATWQESSAYDASALMNCQTNREFQMTLSRNKAPWDSLTINAGQTLNVQYRARSRMGSYVTKELQVLFNPGLSISQEVLVGGRLQQTGGGMVLRSRVRFQKQDIATGGGMILRGRILQ